MREHSCETTQATNDIVREHLNESKNGNGIDSDCHGGTEVNLVNALGFYSMVGSLESLLNLEQKHEMVTAISVEMFPGVLQTKEKSIGMWREAIEAEMSIRHHRERDI